MASKHNRVLFANLALAVGAIAIAAMTLIGRPSSAEAIAPCIPHTPSGEELSFVQQLQSWRNSSVPGSQSLTLSAPLNAAAMGYAQFLADNPGSGGHYADGTPGYAWATRAVNCGYPANLAAGGEGVAVSQGPFGASAALGVMTGQPGSGVNVPANVGLPVQCVGVGMATNGSRVAWVTLLFAANGSCPSAVAGGGGNPDPSPTAATGTSTVTSTPTITPSPTPSPTPTPPPVYHSWFSQLSRD
ncbi:MAG: hypothetical protein AB7J35_04150 [Dehalococcoidia bacterium]